MSAIVFDGDRPRMTPVGPTVISVVLHTPEVEIVAPSAVAEAEAIVRSARLFFYEALTRAWQRAVTQKPFTIEDRAT
jgi:hypothetical protein